MNKLNEIRQNIESGLSSIGVGGVIAQKYLINKWLSDMGIFDFCKIDENMQIHADRHVSLKDKGLNELPEYISFFRCNGNFDISHNNLHSLRGCPKYVTQSFICSYNRLKTLEHGPVGLHDTIDCSHNNLEDLSHAPKKCYAIDCSYNNLRSLNGFKHKNVSHINCSHNKLESLTGLSKFIKRLDSFDCSYNMLDSLVGIPPVIDKLTCDHNFRKFSMSYILSKTLVKQKIVNENDMKKINWVEIKENKAYRGMIDNDPVYFLYENNGTWCLDGIYSNKDISKSKLIECAQEKLNEYGLGNSFSMSGGGQRTYPGGRFGQINRGGFHNSMYGGSDNSMYTYDIIPLNSILQQKINTNEDPDEVMIYPGETVQGKELNKRSEEWIIGTLVSINKSELGTNNFFVVQDEKDNIRKKLDPTTVSVYTKLHNSEKRGMMDVVNFEDADEFSKLKVVKEGLETYVEDNLDILE